MGHDGTRGAIYDPIADNTFDMGKVTDENISLKSGLFKLNIPLTESSKTQFETLFGRNRVITIQGFKVGTQKQIETFIKQFTDVVDINWFNEELQYFPLFHPGNGASEGSQNAKYVALINDMSYRASITDSGFVVYYEVEMFEGDRLFG